VLATLLLASSLASAQEHCRAIDGGAPELAAVDARVRLQFIDDGLRAGARRARIWSWSWLTLYTTLTATYGGLAIAAASRDSKIDYWIATGSSAIGVLTLAAMPLAVKADQRRLSRLLANPPPNAEGQDPCVLLAQAEAYLVRDAASEAFGVSPLVHAGSFVFNAGIAILLGAGFGHWDTAAITGAIGIVVGEAEILSQPTDVVDLLAVYRTGRLVTPTTGSRASRRILGWSAAPLVAKDRVGLTVGFAF
jgi:hypothetical protein